MKKFMIKCFKNYKCFLKVMVNRVSTGHGYDEYE